MKVKIYVKKCIDKQFWIKNIENFKFTFEFPLEKKNKY